MQEQKQIIIVDDELSVRQSLTNYLEDFDFHVSSAGSAEEGLELIQKQVFEIAIVDIRLPGMDGNSFIWEAHKLCDKIKFIVHTGSNYYTLPSRLKKIGMTNDQVFLKPVGDLNQILKLIIEL